jgi:hypothetical protein
MIVQGVVGTGRHDVEGVQAPGMGVARGRPHQAAGIVINNDQQYRWPLR